MEELETKIRQLSLTQTDRTIAEYILDNWTPNLHYPGAKYGRKRHLRHPFYPKAGV